MPVAQPRIEITVAGGKWPAKPELRRLAGRVVKAALASDFPLAPQSELSMLFTDDAHMQRLNAEWRGMDKPTNVLSFPGTVARGEAGGESGRDSGFGPLLGDIVLAAETVQREADADGMAFADHLSHLIVHGFLHLLGYDHQSEEEAAAMEQLEVTILERIGIADPYAGRALE